MAFPLSLSFLYICVQKIKNNINIIPMFIYTNLIPRMIRILSFHHSHNNAELNPSFSAEIFECLRYSFNMLIPYKTHLAFHDYMVLLYLCAQIFPRSSCHEHNRNNITLSLFKIPVLSSKAKWIYIVYLHHTVA